MHHLGESNEVQSIRLTLPPVSCRLTKGPVQWNRGVRQAHGRNGSRHRVQQRGHIPLVSVEGRTAALTALE